MPAKRIYQVKLPTKAGGQLGCVSVVSVGGEDPPPPAYLFILSLKFQKQGTTSEASMAPRVPSEGLACPGLWLPILSSLPSPSQELWVLMGLQGMNILNYSPFHVTEQFQRRPILLFGDP